ncbi:MAG: hypothetical protein EOO53_14110 [Gammaproteobacteria bacterium]|nr:MAG: hypothetical protein EOO53_14110 [Gammaproteobacteria bacterium]
MIKPSPIFYLFTFTILLAACSVGERLTRSATPEASRDYIFSSVDAPQAEKFIVNVSSISESAMCMTNSTWPSINGIIDGASRKVFIIVNDRKYPFKDHEMGYCPFKECAIRIKKAEKIEASLSYKDFDFPEELYSDPKRLIFDPKPFWCDQGKWLN